MKIVAFFIGKKCDISTDNECFCNYVYLLIFYIKNTQLLK